LVSLLAQRVPGDLLAWSRAWVEEPGRPVIEVLNESDLTGSTRVVVRQSDSWGRGRIWPQNLTLFTIGRGADAERTSRVSAKVSLDSALLASTPWDGRPTQRWLLPTGSGIEYGLVVLDDLALLNLLEDVTTIPAPLDRGTAWLVLRDALLDDRVAPRRVYDRVLAALESETNEQLLGLQLGLLSEMYWRYTSDADRLAQAPVVEELVKRRLESAESVSERSLWFRAWRGLVMTESGVQQLRDLWAQDDSIVGLPFSEADFVSMAEALALRVPAEAEAILNEQRSRITNPDRLARFDFVRPALSGDLEQRRAFFASLADPANRAREPWVTAGLGFLHHPLRRAEALEFIAPALEMLPEIQRTGDIFFPSGWLNATLGEHNSEAAVQEVIAYLGRAGSAPMTAERGEFTPQLRGKLLQAADGVVRAARLLGEVPAPLPGARAR
jgi:aminopeptidase N